MLSYIHLENSGMNKMPYGKHLLKKKKMCLNGGAYT